MRELLLLPRATSAQGTLEDYRRAATINQRFANLTTGLTQGVNWIGQTNQAVYRVSVPGGSRFVKVDAEQWTKQPAFDHAAVASRLSSAAGRAVHGDHAALPVDRRSSRTELRSRATRARRAIAARSRARRAHASALRRRRRWAGAGAAAVVVAAGAAARRQRAALCGRTQRSQPGETQNRGVLAGLPDGRVRPELQHRDSACAARRQLAGGAQVAVAVVAAVRRRCVRRTTRC